MELAAGAMAQLAPKLWELLNDEFKLQKGVKEQVKSLSWELESMHAALLKVAEVPREQLDPQVRLWARDAREVSYDMEDVLDAFMVRVEGDSQPSDPGKFKRLMEKLGNLFRKGKARHEIAGAIEVIKKQLQEVSERRRRYSIDEFVAKPASAVTVDPRLLSMYKDVAKLVGIKVPMEELIKMLSLPSRDGMDHTLVSEKKMKVVSVVGFGGLGKTTLVRAVYNKLKPSIFGCGAFVPVGRNPDVKKVLRDILIDLGVTSLDITMLDERQLIEKLREFLSMTKRYFIVIDDIWDKKSWELIKCALVDNDCGSRVVITTRISEVAIQVDEVYKLQNLSRADSEELLHTRIADGKGKCLDSPSSEARDKILNKCDGVPLAIITIASLLASKPAREDWSEVYNSIGFGQDGGNDTVENTRKILSFSYYDLPSHLKACLLYLSAFPEDCEIEKSILIWMWVAEGFVREEGELSLFEVGQRYFNELINRSMIQLVDVDRYLWHMDGCRVHDMVLDMVCSLSSEENFITVVEGNKQREFPERNARRLVLRNVLTGPKFLPANMVMEKVRSFIATGGSLDTSLLPFGSLRVLALDNCELSFKECFDPVNLFLMAKNSHQLRYLRLEELAGTITEELVRGKFKFLQTLVIIGSNIKKLPDWVGLLTQLLCLHANSIKVLPNWIGNLTSLQELILYINAVIEVNTGTRQFLHGLGKLTELRVLRVHAPVIGAIFWTHFLELLSNLHKLHVLTISGSYRVRSGSITWEAPVFASGRCLEVLTMEELKLLRLPSWMINSSSLLLKLTVLTVHVLVLQDQDLEALGRLPELHSLTLSTKYTPLVCIKNSKGQSGYFPKLTRLIMNKQRGRCGSVRFELYGEEDVMMPSLEELMMVVNVRYIKDASNLLGFDGLGLENLHSIQKIRVAIDCYHALEVEVEEAEAELERAAAVHPNRPTLRMERVTKHSMLSPGYEVHEFYTTKIINDTINVRWDKDNFGDLNFVLRWLRYVHIEKIAMSVDCKNANLEEVEEAEAAVRLLADLHLNRPTVEITRIAQDKLIDISGL